MNIDEREELTEILEDRLLDCQGTIIKLLELDHCGEKFEAQAQKQMTELCRLIDQLENAETKADFNQIEQGITQMDANLQRLCIWAEAEG